MSSVATTKQLNLRIRRPKRSCACELSLVHTWLTETGRYEQNATRFNKRKSYPVFETKTLKRSGDWIVGGGDLKIPYFLCKISKEIQNGMLFLLCLGKGEQNQIALRTNWKLSNHLVKIGHK